MVLFIIIIIIHLPLIFGVLESVFDVGKQQRVEATRVADNEALPECLYRRLSEQELQKKKRINHISDGCGTTGIYVD